MNVLFIVLTIIGLSIFEIITSIDNAIINAEVLGNMSQKGRRWFLSWGIIFSVILVRGLLPFLILYLSNPSLGIMGTLTAAFSNDPHVANLIQESSNILLTAGGIFLIFLFLHWLFLEQKHFGLRGEKFFQTQGAWFYAIASVILLSVVWISMQTNAILAFGAVSGSTAFFIIHGFRQYAEDREKNLISHTMSDFSKIAYLEILDASFSIDGVVGAFAFTFAVPLILIGNGLGAIIVRQLTISNIERIKRYKYLKNGAMYSILVLGIIMLLRSLGIELPEWFSPIITFLIVGYFLYKSHINLKTIHQMFSTSIEKQ